MSDVEGDGVNCGRFGKCSSGAKAKTWGGALNVGSNSGAMGESGAYCSIGLVSRSGEGGADEIASHTGLEAVLLVVGVVTGVVADVVGGLFATNT